ncbi:MAG TPA: hypothetical protein VGC14_26710 [Rhizobium sp.]
MTGNVGKLGGEALLGRLYSTKFFAVSASLASFATIAERLSAVISRSLCTMLCIVAESGS